jgi:hypothetical protein
LGGLAFVLETFQCLFLGRQARVEEFVEHSLVGDVFVGVVSTRLDRLDLILDILGFFS